MKQRATPAVTFSGVPSHGVVAEFSAGPIASDDNYEDLTTTTGSIRPAVSPLSIVPVPGQSRAARATG